MNHAIKGKIVGLKDKVIQATQAHDEGLICEVEYLNTLADLVLSTRVSVRELKVGQCKSLEEDIKALETI